MIMHELWLLLWIENESSRCVLILICDEYNALLHRATVSYVRPCFSIALVFLTFAPASSSRYRFSRPPLLLHRATVPCVHPCFSIALPFLASAPSSSSRYRFLCPPLLLHRTIVPCVHPCFSIALPFLASAPVSPSRYRFLRSPLVAPLTYAARSLSSDELNMIISSEATIDSLSIF